MDSSHRNTLALKGAPETIVQIRVKSRKGSGEECSPLCSQLCSNGVLGGGAPSQPLVNNSSKDVENVLPFDFQCRNALIGSIRRSHEFRLLGRVWQFSDTAGLEHRIARKGLVRILES